VFSNRKWMRIALFFNLFGWVFLYLSFQATSSNFKLVTTPYGWSALCVNNMALLATGPYGGIGLGLSKCPDWEHARPAAVVNVENPFLETLGFILVIAGFLLQFLSVPSAKTIAQMRQELKKAQAEEKIKKFKGIK